MNNKPWLSIGMIVKDEIRCIEKCLKALQPLRDRFPCELVIADTGSTDGTREIAQKYADILIDFEWINDFAAARNAVLEKCSGIWYLSVDADEYLEPNLTGFYYLRENEKDIDAAFVTIRNYYSIDMDEDNYGDFSAMRLAKRDYIKQYVGKIHEAMQLSEISQAIFATDIVFKHDGYAFISQERREQKTKRNLDLLEQEIRKDPTNLTRWIECLESSMPIPAKSISYAIQAMEMLMRGDFEKFPIKESAVVARCIQVAVTMDLPQAEQWIAWMWKYYSKMLIIRVDATLHIIKWKLDKKCYEDIIQLSRIYLKGISDFKEQKCDTRELYLYAVYQTSDTTVSFVRLVQCLALAEMGKKEKALELISRINFKKLSAEMIKAWIKVIVRLQDFPQAVKLMNKAVTYFSEEYTDKRLKKVQESFLDFSKMLFQLDDKQEDRGVCKPWRIFSKSKSIFGQIARLMLEEDKNKVEEILREIKEWKYFPPAAIVKLQSLKIVLPQEIYTQNMESQGQTVLGILQYRIEFAVEFFGNKIENDDSLTYNKFLLDLAIVALQNKDIFKKKDTKQINLIYQNFLKVSQHYIKMIYNPVILECETNWNTMTSIHCFAMYLNQAEQFRREGNAIYFLRTLRKALKKAENMRYFVEYIAKEEMERQEQQPSLQALKPEVSAELMDLANKVQTILSQYPEDDPAVKQLKASEAYQKVAWLIEQPSTNYEM